MAPEVTEAHRRAVDHAIQKFLHVSRQATSLPAFKIVWNPPWLAGNGASLGFYLDGSLEMALRSDVAPADLHWHVLHELQHVADARQIRAGGAREWFEARAEAVAEYLADWTGPGRFATGPLCLQERT